jgi:8-oxo-dGTP pyrophosphatase MutT (NUDIX family)
MVGRPHVTVAAVVEQNGRFLLVEEQTQEGLVLNQPAGHWEERESLVEAVVRKTLEETGHRFLPQSLIGAYHWTPPGKDFAYLRFALQGQVLHHDQTRPSDPGIVKTCWLNLDDIQIQKYRHRSPLVLQCIQDYLAGQSFPLDMLKVVG